MIYFTRLTVAFCDRTAARLVISTGTGGEPRVVPTDPEKHCVKLGIEERWIYGGGSVATRLIHQSL